MVAVAAMLLEVATALATPLPLKLLFDRVLFRHAHSGGLKLQTSLSSSTTHELYLILGLVVAVAVADALFTWLDNLLTERLAQRAVYALRRDVFAHLQSLSASFHGHPDTRIGDVQSRLAGDVGSLQDLASNGVSTVVTNILTLTLMTCLMVYLSPEMAAVAFLGTLPLAVVTARSTSRMRQALRRGRKEEGNISALLQESLSAVTLVQAYGRESNELARLDEANTASLRANLRAAGIVARFAPTITALSSLTTAAVLLVGVHAVIGRRITPGELLLFVSYLRAAQSPIRQLAKLGYSVSKATAGLERIEEILARTPDVADLPGARSVSELCSPLRGEVTFDNVSFGYLPNRDVLQGLNLTVPAGKTLALVGSTGAGKSTLLSLLPRFYDPTGGAVRLDGRDLRDFEVASLREQMVLVLQDSIIFRMSVRDNIAYARPEAPEVDVLAAATAAGVDVFAASLPDGMDTTISERGGTLSGGQKQCVAIARAILRASPIVLLDEPTSAMDTATENLVLQGISKLLEGRTVLMIAHRLSTVMNADLVAVLENGQVAECGPPRVLFADSASRFHRLASSQFPVGAELAQGH